MSPRALPAAEFDGASKVRTTRFDWAIVAVTAGPFVFFLTEHVLGVGLTALAAVAFMLGTPHVLATFGLYLDRDIRALSLGDRRRYMIVPALAIPLTVLAFLFVDGTAATVVLTGFLLWQTHHFTKQNLGMFSFWTRARDLPGMAPRERSLILGTTVIGGLGILRATGLVPDLDQPLRIAGVLVLTVGVVWVATHWQGQRSLALLAALAFYSPLLMFDVNLLTAAFAYQAAHGAQYYLMVGTVVHAGRPSPPSLLSITAVLAALFVGAVLITEATTNSAFNDHRWLFGVGKGIVAAHFVADAQLWRLREPAVRGIMKARFSFL